MGHQITKKHTPRRGSLQYWPIVKAKRPYNTFSSFVQLSDKEIGMFAGYKVGMVQVSYIDPDKNSPTFKTEIMSPATVIECPPLLVSSVRFYSNGLPIGEVWGSGLNKNIQRKVKFKENNQSFDTLASKADDLRLVVSSQPWIIGLKKKPEIFEVPMGGQLQSKIEFSKSVLGKEIDITSVFKDGEFLDVSSVTKGKGFTGSVKRFGVKIFPVNAGKSRRKAGNLGAETMAKVQFTVPQHGRLGFNSRVEYNKYLFKIIKNPEEINPKSGFKNFGLVKTTAILIKGSVPGPSKRLVILRKAIRPTKKSEPTKVNVIL